MFRLKNVQTFLKFFIHFIFAKSKDIKMPLRRNLLDELSLNLFKKQPYFHPQIGTKWPIFW